MRSFITCTLHIIIIIIIIIIIRMINKEDEMAGACSTYVRNEKYIQNFGLNPN
jgi:hypothetical protein